MSNVPGFVEYVDKSCEQLKKENSTLENLLSSTGIDKITGNFTGGLENAVAGFIKQSFSKDSALRQMGEDVLSSVINSNARKLSQNVMNNLSHTFNSLEEARDRALVSMVSVLTFQNDMVLYFAATTAKECISAIHEKDKVLHDLLDKMQKLHNALLVLAGGGPFFNKYLEDLRNALILVEKAKREIHVTRSVFFSTDTFPQAHFSNSKELLSQAYDLIMPPVPKKDIGKISGNLLKAVVSKSDYSTQLSMLVTIPKLTMDLLKAYDFYVLKVLKVNALLLGFESIVQNLEKVSNSTFKEMVLKALDNAEVNVSDLTADMATQLNGDETIIDANKQILSSDSQGNTILTTASQGYTPNPTKTSAKSLKWAIDIKTSQAYLETISAQAMGKLDSSNAALIAYNSALSQLSQLNKVITSVAVVEFKSGIETPGAFEADMTRFAIEANRAIMDTTLLEGQDSTMQTKSVLSIGAKVEGTIEIILARDAEIEDILLSYIAATKHLLDGIAATGDSMVKMLHKLKMDKAADSLKKGAIGDFFSMSGKTSTYVGAAVTGLTMAKSLMTSTAKRECVAKTINSLSIAQTSSELLTKRSSKHNFLKQQTSNKKKCAQLQKQKERTEACTAGIDINDLISSPLPELSKVFGGLFGGESFESLGTIKNPVAKIGSAAANNNALSSIKSASEKVNSAKEGLASAINDVKGYKASAEESLDDLKKKADSAKAKVEEVKNKVDEVKKEVSSVAAIGKAIASGDLIGALDAAGVKGQVAEYAKTKAKSAVKYAKTAATKFTDEDELADAAKQVDDLNRENATQVGTK